MTRKELFDKSCDCLANMEDALNTLQDIGFNVESGTPFGNYLYSTCDIIHDIAMSQLEFPNVREENKTHNKLFAMNGSDVEKIKKEVWDSYGIK